MNSNRYKQSQNPSEEEELVDYFNQNSVSQNTSYVNTNNNNNPNSQNNAKCIYNNLNLNQIIQEKYSTPVVKKNNSIVISTYLKQFQNSNSHTKNLEENQTENQEKSDQKIQLQQQLQQQQQEQNEELCKQHPQKKAKYYIQGSNEDRFCSKCALEFAQQGHKIYEIQQPQQQQQQQQQEQIQQSPQQLLQNGNNQRYKEHKIREFLGLMKEMNVKMQENGVEYEEKAKVLREKEAQDTEQVLVYFDQLDQFIQNEKNNLLFEINDFYQQKLKFYEKSLENIKTSQVVIGNFQIEIGENLDSIINFMETEAFDTILQGYNKKIQDIEGSFLNGNEEKSEEKKDKKLKFYQENTEIENLKEQFIQILPKFQDFSQKNNEIKKEEIVQEKEKKEKNQENLEKQEQLEQQEQEQQEQEQQEEKEKVCENKQLEEKMIFQTQESDKKQPQNQHQQQKKVYKPSTQKRLSLTFNLSSNKKNLSQQLQEYTKTYQNIQNFRENSPKFIPQNLKQQQQQQQQKAQQNQNSQSLHQSSSKKDLSTRQNLHSHHNISTNCSQNKHSLNTNRSHSQGSQKQLKIIEKENNGVLQQSSSKKQKKNQINMKNIGSFSPFGSQFQFSSQSNLNNNIAHTQNNNYSFSQKPVQQQLQQQQQQVVQQQGIKKSPSDNSVYMNILKGMKRSPAFGDKKFF